MRFKIMALFAGLLIGVGGLFAQADPVGPFPGRATLIEFPWNSMDGVWELPDSNSGTQFSFEVVHDKDGKNLLHVVQFDPQNGQVLGEGMGLQCDGSGAVQVSLSTVSGKSLTLSLQAYLDDDSHKRFTVMNVEEPSVSTTYSQDFLLRRVSKTPMAWAAIK